MVCPGKDFFGLGPAVAAASWWCACCSSQLVPISGDICEDHQYDDDHIPQEQIIIDVHAFCPSFSTCVSSPIVPETNMCVGVGVVLCLLWCGVWVSVSALLLCLPFPGLGFVLGLFLWVCVCWGFCVLWVVWFCLWSVFLWPSCLCLWLFLCFAIVVMS